MDSFLQKIRLLLDGQMYLRKINIRRISHHLSGSIVEVGVGQGPDIAYFKSLQKVTAYSGCDREEFHSEYTRGKLPPEVTLYRGSKLPYPDSSSNTVISIDCIEHMSTSETEKLLKEAHRILKKNGKCIIMAPFMYPEHCTPYDYFRFTRYGLMQLAEHGNFKIVEVTSRSSTIETIIVTINHELFFSAIPAAIVKHFGTPHSENILQLILKIIFLPLTIMFYILLVAALVLVSSFERNREASTFSLGYSIVLQKQR